MQKLSFLRFHSLIILMNEIPVMKMGVHNKLFKTWAFYVWHILFFIILAFVMTAFANGVVDGWLMDMLESEGSAAVIALIFFGSLFSLSLISILFTRIKVSEEGVTIKSPFAFGGGTYYSFDELGRVKWRLGGRAVNFSGGKTDYWIVPLKHRELAEAINLKTPLKATVARTPKALDYTVLLVPIFALTLVGYVLRLHGLFVNPLIYATIWGVITFLSTACFMYRAWKRYRFSNLDRLGSALTYGLVAGVPVFLFNLLFALL